MNKKKAICDYIVREVKKRNKNDNKCISKVPSDVTVFSEEVIKKEKEK